MSSIDVHPTLLLERILSIEIVRVTERAAVCAARMRGRGDEIGADKMAVDAMRRELNRLPIDGTVVIGEGERDEAPMLYIGERIGTRKGPRVDIAVDPLEGTTLCAKNMPGAITTIAIADSGTLLHAPDVYMEKIALGPGYPKGVVDLDAPVGDNILALANVKGVKPADVCPGARQAASFRVDRLGAQERCGSKSDHGRRHRRSHRHRRTGGNRS
jgi:fructose-1,6-bisphosphatase II / sedoheptulose-1,7-bisphosphatase